MGSQRIAPSAAAAAVKGLRPLFVGSFVNQRGPQCDSSLVTAEAGSSIYKFESSFSKHDSGNLSGESNRKKTSQLGPAQIGVHRKFSRSAIQLAKHSTQDTSGKKKRSAKTASEIASQNTLTQMRPIVFECSECAAISVTKILKDPYDRGVSIIRCMDCRSVNLISDQLGLFKERGSMQRFLRERGLDVRNGPKGRYELTPENIAQTQQQDIAQTQQQEASTA